MSAPERITGPLLLRIPEVASLLRCSERTVWRMLERGELPRVPTRGRVLIPARAVDDLIRGAS